MDDADCTDSCPDKVSETSLIPRSVDARNGINRDEREAKPSESGFSGFKDLQDIVIQSLSLQF